MCHPDLLQDRGTIPPASSTVVCWSTMAGPLPRGCLPAKGVALSKVMFSFQGQLSSSECLMYKTKASTASELPTGLVGCFVAALHQFNFCLSMLPSLLYSCCWQHSPDSFLLANLCLTIRFSGNPTYDIFYFSSFYIRKYDYPLCLSISVCLYLSGQSSFDPFLDFPHWMQPRCFHRGRKCYEL